MAENLFFLPLSATFPLADVVERWNFLLKPEEVLCFGRIGNSSSSVTDFDGGNGAGVFVVIDDSLDFKLGFDGPFPLSLVVSGVSSVRLLRMPKILDLLLRPSRFEDEAAGESSNRSSAEGEPDRLSESVNGFVSDLKKADPRDPLRDWDLVSFGGNSGGPTPSRAYSGACCLGSKVSSRVKF